MKSGLLALISVGGLFLAAPASAQGVKIGILNDQSGVYADYGGKYSLEAAKMAVEDFGGEVLGQKVEIVSADHQNKPDLGVSIARRWYDVEGVDMITELTTSSVALAIHELSKEKKKIDIVVGAATSRLTGDACQPYGFHWAYDTHALAYGTGGSRRRMCGICRTDMMSSVASAGIAWRRRRCATPVRRAILDAGRRACHRDTHDLYRRRHHPIA